MTDLILENDINIDINEEIFDKNIVEEFKKIKKKINNSRENLLKKFNSLSISNESINILIKKSNLIEHIQSKCNKLSQKIRLIELKNNRYKRCYTSFNIGIIFLSTLLTTVESTKLVTFDECIDNNYSNAFKLTPIFLGSFITFSASILKFKKYQEKMENIVKLVERGNNVIGTLKKIKEELIFCNKIEFYNKIEDKYKSEIYEFYTSISQEIDKILKDIDYDKYLELIHNTDYKVFILENKKKIFFKNYESNNEVVYELNKKIPTNTNCINI